MITTEFDEWKNIKRILQMIKKQVQITESRYQRETKYILFSLINYYAGKTALNEIEYLNNKTHTFATKAELDEKMNGKNKPNSEHLIKILVRDFNTYCKVYDNWEKKIQNGKSCWVNTGLYCINFDEIPDYFFERIKKIYDTNLAEDIKTFEELTKEKYRQNSKIQSNKTENKTQSTNENSIDDEELIF